MNALRKLIGAVWEWTRALVGSDISTVTHDDEDPAPGPVSTRAAGGPGGAESGPPHSAAGTGLADAPVPSAPHAEDEGAP